MSKTETMTTELQINSDLYTELKEPNRTFAEIVALLMSFTDDELATLNEDKFASALITLHH
jgi:hypothetical protein